MAALDSFIFLQVLGLLIALYFASRYFLAQLGRWFFKLFKNHSLVIRAVSFFLLPGTFIHEVAHLVFAEFLQVRTDGLSVVPEIKEDKTIKLGGVKIEQTDPLRRTIIGLAPVFLGLILLWVSTGFFFGLTEPEWYYYLLYVYLLLQIGLTMFSSSKDLEGSLVGFILFSFVFFVLKYLSEIIVFAPLDRAEALISNFFSSRYLFLRNGLVLSGTVIFGLGWLLSLLNRSRS